jgi:hypothetical protein
LEDDFPDLLANFICILVFVLASPIWAPIWLIWFFVFRKK